MSMLLLQDEREVKRQRRKQSNRESARRSRLRKQAECETLSQKVDALVEENARLRTLNKHLQEQLDKLISGFGKVIHLQDPATVSMSSLWQLLSWQTHRTALMLLEAWRAQEARPLCHFAGF